MNANVMLYTSIGEELIHYDVNVESATLTRRGAVKLPANVQYLWPHPSKRYVYVATSNRGAAVSADINHLSALRVDPRSGALASHGDPRPLRWRPIHMSLDATGRYALIAHNEPPAVTVMRVTSDGTIGDEVVQPDALDCGIYPHQILATPSNRSVILVARGNSAKSGKPEDPGALKLLRLNDGILTNAASIAPGGGYGFGPRHLDFHPTRPWVYVSLERQNKLNFFRMHGDDVEPQSVATLDTLANPADVKPRQLAGAIHVSPDGGFVYVINRADWTVDFAGKPVFGGGENSIVAYAIDQTTGVPSFLQRIDPRLYHVRTFAIDPSGRMLVAANIKPMTVREGNGVAVVPAGLSVFRRSPDGKLEFVRRYNLETAGKLQFWMGMVLLP